MIIYMPMITEALVAMLACARIGAIIRLCSAVCRKRIGRAHRRCDTQGDPCCVLRFGTGRTVAYKPLIDGAIEIAEHKPDVVFMFQREECVADMIEGRDYDWNAVQEGVEPAPCVPVRGITLPIFSIHLVRQAHPRALCGQRADIWLP